MRHPTHRHGFTLVETMVAIGITGLISLSLVQALQASRRSNSRTRTLIEMQQNARAGLNALADDLRHVSYGKDPTQPSIDYAGPDSTTFIADVLDEHPGAERITYFLSREGDPLTRNPDDTVLWRVVSDTAGVVLLRAPQSYGISRGGLGFRWFNGGGVELPNPVPQPEQVGEIAVSLTAAAPDPIGSEYPELELSATIYPRNLPLSPARSRPNAPGCGSLDYPNCESATMTWTTPTQNTDGTDLPLSDISHFSIYFGTDPDEQSLYTKLARTINEWTIPNLVGGHTYYLSVTCVSRSGVESYKCTRSADMSSNRVPNAPDDLAVAGWGGGGLRLAWTGVSTFTGGETISTPVTYNIYRDLTSGFEPDADNLLSSVTYATEYVDTTMVSCSTVYYQVRAMACGNEGDSSPEATGSLPAPPSCPSSITAVPGAGAGSVDLTWVPPTTRVDGSALDPADIQGYVVVGDTLPGSETVLQEIEGAVSGGTVTGLENCANYYLNLRCIDDCSHTGDYCPGNEVMVFTASPCDEAPPEAPPALSLNASDDRIDLQWPANHTDCDLAGYRIYYGTNQGGPYNGTGAAEGPSPVEVDVQEVEQGDVCRAALTSLSECQLYYVVVKAIDRCEPPRESAASPEADGITTCTPCQMATCCNMWTVTGSSQNLLHLEVYTTNSGGETLTRLIPTYNGSQLMSEVWFGRPLVRVWSADGGAGQDGPVGPQPSGTTLNITDVIVPSTTKIHHGIPLTVLFDSDVRDVPMDIGLRGLSGSCDGQGTGRGALLHDDFDDLSTNGWTRVSGSWSAPGGDARQTLTSGNYVMLADGLSLGDFTYEAKLLTASGTVKSSYLVFRYQNSSNYYVCGIRADTDRIRIGKIRNGAWSSEPAYYATTINENQYYTLRLVVTGTRAQVWYGCNKVIDVNDSSMWLTGGVGLSTRQATGKFDDIKIMAGAQLP